MDKALETAPTADRLRGLAVGAAILTGFGAFWVLFPLLQWKEAPGWALPLASSVGAALLALSAWRFVAAARAPHPDDAEAARKGRALGMAFGIIFGLEGALIGLGAVVLSRMGLSEWIPFLTALLVGLHFLPLARVFDVALYFWTGTALVLLAVGCACLPEPSFRLRVLGLAVGATLWLTAGLALWKTRRP
jgi:hypothetical protein